MRVGTAIFLGLLALFGFGFFLAHSFNLSQELTEARAQLARLQAESQMLEAQYQALLEEKNRLTDQVSGLAGENGDLRRQVHTLEAERLSLTRQIQTLQAKLGLAARANPLLAWLVFGAPGRGIAALLVVPMVPLSLGVAYILTHGRAANSPSGSTNGRDSNHTTIRALLTREEFHLIARHRRSRAAGWLQDTLPG